MDYLVAGSLSGNHAAMPADGGLGSVGQAEAPANAAEIREELIWTETALRLMGLAFLGWAALIAAERIRNFDLQRAAFELAPWSWLGGLSGQMALPILVGTSLCFLLPSARIGSNALSVFFAFTVQLGFLPALFVLRVINSKQAQKVLSRDYEAIRQATPEQNLGLWIGPFAVGVVVLLGILFAMDSAWALA